MASLGEAAKERITKALVATYFKQRGFIVKYNDESNPVVTITFSVQPEYQFAISSISGDSVFTTSECPGLHLDAAETFRRNDFEVCINAIQDWAERIREREQDSIIDQYGGMADTLPEGLSSMRPEEKDSG